MISINELIIVEGKSDVAFLSQFINAPFVITNGLNVDESLLKRIAKFMPNPGAIILTDPDSPGKKIRQAISERFPDIKHAYIDIKHSKKNGKVGVAESTVEAVLKSLAHIQQYSSLDLGNLNIADLYQLGLYGHPNSAHLREVIIDKFNMGHSNGKIFMKTLNRLKITYSEILTALEEVR